MHTNEQHAARIAELEALAPSERWTAIEGLRQAWESWARATLELEPAGDLLGQIEARATRGIERGIASDASHRLAMAEKQQWLIGTAATGSGEGLASMHEVRTLQLARAWTLLAIADAASLAEARSLVDQVAGDANSTRLRPRIDALLSRLRAWP